MWFFGLGITGMFVFLVAAVVGIVVLAFTTLWGAAVVIGLLAWGVAAIVRHRRKKKLQAQGELPIWAVGWDQDEAQQSRQWRAGY